MARDGKNEPNGSVILRTTTTKRWVTRTVVVEELVAEPPDDPPPAPESPPAPAPSLPRRRAEDIATALAVTAGLEPASSERRAAPGGGRRSSDRFLRDEELEEQAIQVRAYWARRVGKVHRRLEERLKPMILEFGLELMKVFIDRVREQKGDRGPSDLIELLFAEMRRARREGRADEVEDDGGE